MSQVWRTGESTGWAGLVFVAKYKVTWLLQANQMYLNRNKPHVPVQGTERVHG